MEQKRILVVDDERDLCDILLFNLRAAGYQAEAAYSAELLDKVWPQDVIVKNAVQLHGGTITISTPDTGSLTFEFTLKTEGAFS